jgi:2-polyprenyl-3-methyl-5-hydroxy-6-metoxy-1,4-benzoquinol methylase
MHIVPKQLKKKSAVKTREPQYQFQIALDANQGRATFGLMTNAAWDEDPRRMLFLLSRYKFVAKMLHGKESVLEVGCGDGIGTRLLLQDVKKICAVDFDPVFVKDVNDRMSAKWQFDCHVHDILSRPVPGYFDAAFSLDVLEHIGSKDEAKYITNIRDSISENGVLIIGTPSIESQPYASPASKEGHVNCKNGKSLRELLSKYFYNVFLFSMNDEVVHTGFHPMAHYLFAICCGKRTLARRGRSAKK